jgi:hypothetical protein
MNKILTIIMLLVATLSQAELPSWGMTENQYKLPNFNAKIGEIGKQAAKNNWLLKITAPKDWHNKIRMGLTDSGARDVQVNFKDSLYNSIAISAAPGIKMAQVSSSDASTTTVQKQVVIDKPEIDTEVDAPDFGKIEIESNGDELLGEISNLEIPVPVTQPTDTRPAAQPTRPAPQAVAPNTGDQVAEPVAMSLSEQSMAMREENKEELRKRHARTKRVDKLLSYASINSKDDLFIQGDVVLIKRFINRGVVLFFWMKEAYDPSIHKLVEKGSGKYQKDPEAVAGDQVTDADEQVEEAVEITPTNLDFVAVDNVVEDQDDLRRSHARNRRVDLSISASQLKSDDILYVQNQTVLVERPITSSQSTYFWLVGDTTINMEVERTGDNEFEIK